MKTSQGALETRASNALTLHLEEFQAKDMIDIVEKRIIDTADAVQKLEEPKQKAFEEYEKLQDRYDNLKAKLTADQRLVDSLSRYSNNLKQGVDLRIMRAESHNEMKPREKRKYQKRRGPVQFTWMVYAEETLKEYGKFIQLDDLWDFVVDRYDLKDKIKAIPKGGHTKVKWGAIHNCWLANAAKTREGGGRGSLIAYENGYIGLKEWAYDDYKPRPEYITTDSKVTV
jgi:hypothetical protein